MTKRSQINCNSMERTEENNFLVSTLECLVDINKIVLETGSFEAVLERVFDAVKDIVGAEGAGLLLYDEETKCLTLQKPAFGTYDDQLIDLYTVSIDDGGNAVEVFQSGEPYLSNNAAGDPRFIQTLIQAFRVRNIISVPVIVSNKRIGVFHVVNKPGEFHSGDVEVIKLLVSQLAVAMENARLLCRVKTQEAQARALYELSMQFKLSNVEHLARLALQKIRASLPVSCTALAVSVGRGQQGKIIAQEGGEARWVGRLVSLLPSAPTLKYLSEKPLEEVEAEAAALGMQIQIALPIESDSVVYGKIWAWRKKKKLFSSSEIRFLSLVAYQLAVALENAGLFERQREMAQRLQRLMELNERLVQLVLDGAGVQAITDTLARHLNAGVIFCDARLIKRAWAPAANRELRDFDPSLFLVTQEESFTSLKDHNQHLRLQYDGVKAKEVIAAPVEVGRETLGYLVVLRDAASHEEDLLPVIQRALPVYALEMLKEQIARQAIQQVEGDLVSALLGGKYPEREILQRASRLGYDLSGPHVVVVAEHETQSSDAISDPPFSFWRPLLGEVSSVLKQQGFRSLVVALQEQLVVLLPCSSSQQREIERLRGPIEQLRKELSRNASGEICIGIGRVAASIKDIEGSYRDACFTIKYMKQKGMKNKVTAFRDLGFYQVLARDDTADYLFDLALESLGPLLEADKTKNTSFLRTLDCYFASGCSIKAAASSLSCHVNTIRYRLERIKQLLQLDVEDVEHRFNLEMALRLAKFHYPELF